MPKFKQGFTRTRINFKEICNGHGFTLIELLVVIAIIAILAVVGVVVFRSVTGGARDGRRKADINEIAKAYEVNFNGSYQALLGSQFSSGTIPHDPHGEDYTILQDTVTTGLRVCAALEVNSARICTTLAEDCFCLSSTQVSAPTSTNYTPITNSASICPSSLNSGLLGYWKMDEGSGTNTVDSSGNGNNGILINGPSWDSGKSGSAISFDGTDDYVDAGSFNLTKKMTVSFWVKLLSYNPSRVQGFIGSGYFTDNKFWFGPANSNNYWMTYGANYSGPSITTFPPANDINKWVYWTLVYDGSLALNNLYVYRDGFFVQARGDYTGDINPNVDIQIAKQGWDRANFIIDDVRIYNRALSGTEISTLYSCIP